MRLPIVVVAVMLLAGCAGTKSPTGEDQEMADTPEFKMITMVDNTIKNGDMSLDVNDRAMYMNRGSAAHTVTVHMVGDGATMYKLDTELQPGKDATYSFAAPGTYHVFCKLHGTMTSGMTSTVTVA